MKKREILAFEPLDVLLRLMLCVLDCAASLLILPLACLAQLAQILARDVLKPTVRELKRGQRELRKAQHGRVRNVKRVPSAIELDWTERVTCG